MKKLIALILAACVFIGGCGSREEKETESGNVSEERVAETDSGKEESEPEMIDGFKRQSMRNLILMQKKTD